MERTGFRWRGEQLLTVDGSTVTKVYGRIPAHRRELRRGFSEPLGRNPHYTSRRRQSRQPVAYSNTSTWRLDGRSLSTRKIRTASITNLQLAPIVAEASDGGRLQRHSGSGAMSP